MSVLFYFLFKSSAHVLSTLFWLRSVTWPDFEQSLLSFQDGLSYQMDMIWTLLICMVHGYILGAVKAEKLSPDFKEFPLWWVGVILVPRLFLLTGTPTFCVCIKYQFSVKLGLFGLICLFTPSFLLPFFLLSFLPNLISSKRNKGKIDQELILRSKQQRFRTSSVSWVLQFKTLDKGRPALETRHSGLRVMAAGNWLFQEWGRGEGCNDRFLYCLQFLITHLVPLLILGKPSLYFFSYLGLPFLKSSAHIPQSLLNQLNIYFTLLVPGTWPGCRIQRWKKSRFSLSGKSWYTRGDKGPVWVYKCGVFTGRWGVHEGL